MVDSILLVLLILVGLVLLTTPFTILLGLYKVLFQKEDKEFGIKLLTYSVIVILIGFGTCGIIGLVGI